MSSLPQAIRPSISVNAQGEPKYLPEESEIAASGLNRCARFSRWLPEAAKVIARALRQIMPDGSGAVFLISDFNHTLEMLAKWGECDGFQPGFEREACWALRRGGTHSNAGGQCCGMCSPLRRPARPSIAFR